MRAFSRRIVVPAVLSLFAFAGAARACGPDLPYAVFAHPTHPDLPLGAYAAGHLGVIQPGWARSYLCMAYRWMDGAALDADEQRSLVATWLARDDSGWYPGSRDGESWIDDWRAARAKVPRVPLPVTHQPNETAAAASGDLVTEVHGSEDAFRTATRVLEEKLRTPGAASPAVRAWVLAQDTVFAACSGNPVGLTLHAPGTVPADRAYQEAAYQMYGGQDDDAAVRFAAIARGPDARLRPLAAYLVARLAVRAAAFEPDEEGGVSPTREQATALEAADSVVQVAMADTALARAGLLPALHRLRGAVRFRSHPVERMGELAKGLLLPRSGATIGQDLWDLAWLMDRALGEWADGNAADSTLRTRLREQAAANDLTDWVMTLQGLRDGGPFASTSRYDDASADVAKDPRTLWWAAHRGDAYAHAYARWRARGSQAWLVAALLAATPRSPGVDSLLAAAEKVGTGAPGYATVATRRAGLLAARGDLAGARAVCAAALASPGLPISAANTLRAVRMRVAADAAESFAFAVRTPVAVVSGPDGLQEIAYTSFGDSSWDAIYQPAYALAHQPIALDEDGAALFDAALPLARWREAAAGTALPARLRREVALAGWMRALLLGREDDARAFATAAASAAPECRAELDAWAAAPTPEARAFAAAAFVARHPGVRPIVRAGLSRLPALDQLDSYRDNWWCAGGRASEYDADTLDAAPPVIAAGAFPGPAERAVAAAEARQVRGVTGAPEWFAPLILAWAKAHPEDPRVPEALHRVVRGVRLGCTSGRTPYARDAFRLLQARYPTTSWAKKTRTWSW